MNAPVDFPALKVRQQAAWGSGDYAVIGTTLQIVGESLAVLRGPPPRPKTASPSTYFPLPH